MCQINCPNRATHLVHAADRSGLSLDACGDHLDAAREAVAAMATPGVEIKTTRM
jgi:hypothetical protein